MVVEKLPGKNHTMAKTYGYPLERCRNLNPRSFNHHLELHTGPAINRIEGGTNWTGDQ